MLKCYDLAIFLVKKNLTMLVLYKQVQKGLRSTLIPHAASGHNDRVISKEELFTPTPNFEILLMYTKNNYCQRLLPWTP